MFRLVITTMYGLKRKHYYDNYDEMDYNATFCRFSPNVSNVIGQKLTIFGWKTIFTIN
jgi:hypothetical protein